MIYTYLSHIIMKEFNIRGKDLDQLVKGLDEEYVFNLYAKMINMFGIVEYMSVVEAREGLKKYFEAMSSDLGLLGLENKNGADNNNDEDMRIDNSCMINIKDINWKLVPIMKHEDKTNLNSYFQAPSLNENLSDVLDSILSKDRFFEKPSMAFPLRFAILGTSSELQILCQNLGSLFEVYCF